MSVENYSKGQKEKKHERSKKIIILETQIAGWLKNPSDCLRWIDTIAESSLIKKLEVLQAILHEMRANYANWTQHYALTRVEKLISQLMTTFKDALYEFPKGHAEVAYQFTFSFIRNADYLLKRLPARNKKPPDDALDDAMSGILCYLHDILNSESFRDPSPVDPNSLLSLLNGLKKHKLISQTSLSMSISFMGKLAESNCFEQVKLDRIDKFFKNQELTAENAGYYLEGMASLANKKLLRGIISAENINFLLENIFSSNNLFIINIALGNLRKLIEKKWIKKADDLNFSCINRYFQTITGKSDGKKSKSKSSALKFDSLDPYILSGSVNHLSHICRDLKKIGSFRSDISMSSLEHILENVASSRHFNPKIISDALISVGHIVQAQGKKSSEKLKGLVKTLLNKINDSYSASNLKFNGIANALYGSLLLQVLDSSSTDKLTDFFKESLVRLSQRSKSNLEKFHSYVNQIAQYIRHFGNPISKEMKYLIKQRRPLINKKSFEYQLIEYVKKQSWFKHNQKINDQFESDIYFVDGKVDLVDEGTFYIVEIDGDIFHDPIKDRRRDKQLLKFYEDQHIETMGIIRIPVKKYTTMEEAAADWKRQYEEKLVAYKKSKIVTSEAREDSPDEEKESMLSYSDPENPAEEESAEYMYDLASRYEQGIEVEVNTDEAIKLYSLAANKGLLKAQQKLAICYEQGVYVEQDFKKSYEYHSLAANQKNPESLLNLAFYHFSGIYVDQSIALGEDLLMRALASQSHQVRKKFEDNVGEFLNYLESGLIQRGEKITSTDSLRKKDSPDDLICRLNHLMKIISSQKIKQLNRVTAYSLSEIFLREILKEKNKRQLQVANLIQVGQWAGTPWRGESKEKEKIVKNDVPTRKPLGDITNTDPKYVFVG